MNNNTYTENDVLRLVSEKTEGSYIEGDTLIVPDDEIYVRTEIVQCQENNGSFMAQLVFYLSHPGFEQAIVESCAGVGNTANEAIEMAAGNFGATVLLAVQTALKCDGDEFVTAKVMGKEHIFHVPCFSGTLNMGDQVLEKGDLWTLMQDAIVPYLGCKKVYWVKLFAAVTGDSITCEVRINGAVFSGLTQLLRERLPLNGKKTKYASYKAFIVLIQKDETFTPCPYTADDVNDLTVAALEKLKTAHDQESHDRIIADIIDSAPVKSLGWEMAGLIPELFCMMILNLGENDGLMYYNRTNGESENIKRSQLSSYDSMAGGIFNYIRKNEPSKEENLQVLKSSGMFLSINKALNDGAKMEDLRISDIMYTVGDGYTIY